MRNLLLKFFVILDLKTAWDVSFADVGPAEFDFKFNVRVLSLLLFYAEMKSNLRLSF